MNESPNTKSGVITTFYSYKGGVGRSFLLANAATVLAEWGYKVLCVDWDIEAPGLSYYYKNKFTPPLRSGVLQFLHDSTVNVRFDHKSYISKVNFPETLSFNKETKLRARGELWIMPAGAEDSEYFGRIQHIDWQSLYCEFFLGEKIESWRAEVKECFDFILIDSRTGLTEFSGIVTAHLPDILAMVFTANEQSVSGCVSVVQKAINARNSLPFDQSGLLVLPILSKFDKTEEFRLAEIWQKKCFDNVAHFFENWAPRHSDARTIFENCTVPYFAYWSFGESLAVLETERRSAHDITYFIENIAAIVSHGLANIELFERSRDEYVKLARRKAGRSLSSSYDIFVCSSNQQLEQYVICEMRHMEPNLLIESSFGISDFGETALDDAIDRCANMLVILEGEWTELQSDEVKYFLLQNLNEERKRKLEIFWFETAQSSLFSWSDRPAILTNIFFRRIEGRSCRREIELFLRYRYRAKKT